MGLVSRMHNMRLQSQINRDFGTSESLCVFHSCRQHENAPKVAAREIVMVKRICGNCYMYILHPEICQTTKRHS